MWSTAKISDTTTIPGMNGATKAIAAVELELVAAST
jgi:hypothetical protein